MLGFQQQQWERHISWVSEQILWLQKRKIILLTTFPLRRRLDSHDPLLRYAECYARTLHLNWHHRRSLAHLRLRQELGHDPDKEGWFLRRSADTLRGGAGGWDELRHRACNQLAEFFYGCLECTSIRGIFQNCTHTFPSCLTLKDSTSGSLFLMIW